MFDDVKTIFDVFTYTVALEIRREMEREWAKNPFDENPRDFQPGFIYHSVHGCTIFFSC